MQAYYVFGTFDPDPEEVNFLAEDELTVNKDGKSCLMIRLKNCTGNTIDLDSYAHYASRRELLKAEIVRSVDYKFRK